MLEKYKERWILHCAWKEMDPPRSRKNFEKEFKKLLNVAQEDLTLPHAQLIISCWHTDAIHESKSVIKKNEDSDLIPT